MKNKIEFPFHFKPAARGLLLCLVFLSGASAVAQNLLKNGDFESPFPVADPTTGWTVVFPGGGDGDSGDWAIAGRTLFASRVAGGHGAHLRPNNPGTVHAYFKQVVTNLTEGARYTLSIQKLRPGTGEYGIDKLQVYMVALSGSSSNTVYGNASINGPYSMTITCSTNRQIEVQLHNWKRWMDDDTSEDFKHAKCSAWFDDCSLTLSP